MNTTPPDNGIPGESAADRRRREREARLAEALRANLKRRKARERGRGAIDEGPASDAPEGNDSGEQGG